MFLFAFLLWQIKKYNGIHSINVIQRVHLSNFIAIKNPDYFED